MSILRHRRGMVVCANEIVEFAPEDAAVVFEGAVVLRVDDLGLRRRYTMLHPAFGQWAPGTPVPEYMAHVTKAEGRAPEVSWHKLDTAPARRALTHRDVETVEQVEALVHRAIMTHDVQPDHERGWIYQTRVQWPAFHESFGWAEEERERFQPTPEDVDNMMPALGWIVSAALIPELSLLKARAYGFSFTAIADKRRHDKNRSPEWWRTHYKKVLKKIHNVARKDTPERPEYSLEKIFR